MIRPSRSGGSRLIEPLIGRAPEGGADAHAEDRDYWLRIPDDRPFGQGDILRGSSGGGSADPTFGLVITADCDIVQSKAGDRLTYVEVVPTREYLERIWIPDQLRKHVKK